MTPSRSFLSESLGAWREVRDGVIAEVDNIRSTKFDFRPTAETRSVRELVQHILEVASMMTGELTRADTDFRRAPWPDLLRLHGAHVQDAQNKKELLELLHAQIDEAEKAFRKCGELEMLQFIQYFDGSRGTKLQWLHHGIGHELYHRGQLTVYARLLGVEPARTHRTSGESGEREER